MLSTLIETIIIFYPIFNMFVFGTNFSSSGSEYIKFIIRSVENKSSTTNVNNTITYNTSVVHRVINTQFSYTTHTSNRSYKDINPRITENEKNSKIFKSKIYPIKCEDNFNNKMSESENSN